MELGDFWHNDGGDSWVVASRTSKQEGPGSIPGGGKSLVMELVNIYHSLSCSFVEIKHLYVVSVCIN